MTLDLATITFEPWVVRVVAASNALSGIHREPTQAEIAAHRGVFARRTVAAIQIVILQSHLGDCRTTGAARRGADPTARIAALLDADLAPWPLYAAFRALSPFPSGNRRCARALWTSRRLAEGYRPERDGLPREWAEAFLVGGTAGETHSIATAVAR